MVKTTAGEVDDPILTKIVENTPDLPSDSEIGEFGEFYGTSETMKQLKQVVKYDFQRSSHPGVFTVSDVEIQYNVSDLPEDVRVLSDQVGRIEAKLVFQRVGIGYSTLQRAARFGFSVAYKTGIESNGLNEYEVGVINPIEKAS